MDIKSLSLVRKCFLTHLLLPAYCLFNLCGVSLEQCAFHKTGQTCFEESGKKKSSPQLKVSIIVPDLKCAQPLTQTEARFHASDSSTALASHSLTCFFCFFFVVFTELSSFDVAQLVNAA